MAQIYIALLKFDFFFFLAFTVQFLVVVTHTGTAEKALTIAAIPITIVLLFLAAFITRRESTAGQSCVILVYFAAMAYFIFKLVRMYDSRKSADYDSAKHSLTTFAVLTIMLLVVTIVTASMCMANFNQGLEPHLMPKKGPTATDLDPLKYNGGYPANSPHTLEPLSARMTID